MALNFWRRWRLFIGLAIILVAASGGWSWWQSQQREAALQEILARPLPDMQAVRIPRGSSLRAIANIAQAAGAPLSAAEFVALARRLRVDDSLQAGVYRFSTGQSVEDMLHAIAVGKVVVEKITFIEGTTFAAMRDKLIKDKRLRHVLPALSDDALRATLNIAAASLEGLFLPDTYFFNDGDTDLSVLRRAHQRLQQALAKHWQTRTDGGVYKTPYDALILASIVEKETGKGEERELIASVFVNRLRKGIRLQADPTVIYGLGARFDGNLTRRHLREDTPYNTYVHAGLTPTPIALVGEAAIYAALHPAESDYYYFVATGDGMHYFSKSLREHNNAVNRYQRRRKAKQ